MTVVPGGGPIEVFTVGRIVKEVGGCYCAEF